MTLAAAVYTRAGALIGTLTKSFDRAWHDVINDVGDFRLSLDNDETTELGYLVYGRVVRLSLDGTQRFAGLIERQNRTSVDPSEEIGQKTVVSGRGTLAIFEEAIILPVMGVDRLSFADHRLFNFASPDFDASAWTAVLTHAQTGGPGGAGSHNTIPQRWPDSTSLKIWHTWTIGDRPATVGDVYARKTFTTTTARGVYRVFATADDGYEVWIDGEYVMGETTPLIWNETASTEVVLDSGTHTIAMKGTNLSFPDNSDNVAWMMCSVIETTDGGASLGSVVVNTDGTWTGVGYPANPPGFTPGKIIRLLVAEAQARGALTGVTLGFTDSADSGSTAWPVTSDVAFQVGSDLLTAIKQLCETYMDVAMDPASLRLDAWAVRGSTKSVTLTAGSNVSSLVHDGTA